MPYKTLNCDCGEEIETFISQSEESNSREECDCGRVIRYKSPPMEGITETSITREIGEVQESDF